MLSCVCAAVAFCAYYAHCCVCFRVYVRGCIRVPIANCILGNNTSCNLGNSDYLGNCSDSSDSLGCYPDNLSSSGYLDSYNSGYLDLRSLDPRKAYLRKSDLR